MYRNDTNAAPRSSVHSAARAQDSSSRIRYRNRDFGVGYGSSSGYAAARRYAPSQSPARFRLV
ncbi:MAG: hypothetical protein GX856_01030 [Gammaproteobacteria bacterium]|nr:hypothetical protein [Gammaproteobacteria bacterium]